MDASSSVTELLHQVSAGDPAAMDRLFPLVYAELRRLADGYMRRERSGHTLQATALVHEAYMRLCQDEVNNFQNRAHFMAIAARVMRRILVDYARRRHSQKRSVALRAPLDEAQAVAAERPLAMIHLDDALNDLEKQDERKARLIEMRFFGGLTVEESAAVLGLESSRVRRELRLAQAWLERALNARTPGVDA